MVAREEIDALSRAAHFGRKTPACAGSAMAISSHPLITRIAVETMGSGGNACDAALAAAVAQTIVEPHMTTLTGVLSMLHFEAETRSFTYVNGSATAPKDRPERFTPADTKTGLGVAVPGYWAGFEAALERHGSLPRRRLLEPAISLAGEGFVMHPFLYALAFESMAEIGSSQQAREVFMPSGTMLTPGQRIVQTRAARTLERLADEGSDYFYRGEFARHLVDVVRGAGGVLSLEDLDSYEARWMEPARGTYRGLELIASPIPDQGGTHLIEMLNMVELIDLAAKGHPLECAETLGLLIRIHNEVYIAGAVQRDPRSFPVSVATILSKEYARHRLELIKMTVPRAPSIVTPGSNHITVVDPQGNVATLLHSCMCVPWVNGLFVDGFTVAAAASHFLRVLPRPGDRISSIIAPNMLVRDGVPVLASGSPSQSLLATALQNIINMVDFGMSIEESVHLPRFGGPGPRAVDTWAGPGAVGTMLEVGVSDKVRSALVDSGLAISDVGPWHHMCGSFEGILRNATTGELTACGDPRRNSQAEGF